MKFAAAPKAIAVCELIDPVGAILWRADDAMFVATDEIWGAAKKGAQVCCCGRVESKGIENFTIPLPKSRPMDLRAVWQNPLQFP